MLASIGVASTDAATAYLVQPFVDRLIVAGDLSLAKIIPFIVIFFAIFKGLSRYLQEYNIRTAGQGALQDIRNAVFEHSLRLSMRFHSDISKGGLMSRILNDINVLQSAVSDVLVSILRESITMVALTGYAFYTDWQLALMAFIAIPVSAWPASAIGKKIKKFSRRGQDAMGDVTAVLEQSVSGIKVIKAFATEQQEVARFVRENGAFFKLIRKTFRYSAASAPVMEILTSLGVAAVLWYGLDRVSAEVLTKGELFSILAAILLMYTPLKRLTKVNNTIQTALGAASRVFEILDTRIEIRDADNAVPLSGVQGQVQFSHVSFAYDEEPVLFDFNLDVNPGEIIALVGASGAGKSTIVSLLNRFYDPQEGSISIDGFDLREVTLDSLHQVMALVDQETFLFDDTIANNIRYGSTGADLAKVRSAAKKAFADEFILQMPSGYDSFVGDRGVRLSGGQRQRICIARAILKDAPILLLDEATSALDTEGEAIVQKALSNLMIKRTTFVVAHRLSTIMHANSIVVMEFGKIVEQGNHEDLLRKGGAYRRLYDAQFKV
jgi:subfamily B ATP-binding cassette protein MsbA